MDEDATLNQLEELAQRLGITVRYESWRVDGSLHPGGFCRVRGEDFVIINRKASREERIHIFAAALKRYDLSQIYILPSLRELLEIREEGEFPGEPS